MPRELVDAIIGVFIPPVLVYMKKKVGTELLIDVLLWIFTWVLAILYAFHLEGMDPVINILCCYIPPLGYYLSKKAVDVDLIICLIGWLFIYPVGIVWAYHKA